MSRRRLGVVLLVPAPIATEVDGLRRALAGEDAVGKVAPHITLVPPVNVREDDLGAALAVVRRAAAASGPLTLDLGPVETFLPVNPVAYLAVRGPALASLHALHDAVLDGPLARPLTHDFVPHVTVAEELDEDRALDAVAVLAHYHHSVVTFRLVHVLEEVRDEGGRRVWHPILGVALGVPAVVGRGGLELVIEHHDRVPPDAAGLAPGAEADLVLVGRRAEAVVGVMGGRVRGRKAWLEWSAVAPDVEGEGVGTQLLAAFEVEAGRRGATQVFARAVPGERSERFLAGRGWAREDPPPMVRGRIGPAGDG
jgi:2'-5' RNA ligase